MGVPKWMSDKWKEEYLARLPKRCRYKVIEGTWIDPMGRVSPIFHLWNNKTKKHISSHPEYSHMVDLALMHMEIDRRYDK